MEKDRIYIQHIYDAILTIESFTAGLFFEDFLEDKLVQDGVIRELEIMGEAAGNLSLEFKDAHHQIPWKEIAGMRDKLIHGYMRVDLDIVWQTLKENLPKLKEQIEELIES